MGILAGVLAAVAVLPTIVPLTRRVADAEDVNVIERTIASSSALSVLFDHQLSLPSGLARRLRVDGVRIVDVTGRVQYDDGTLPITVPISSMCPPGEAPGTIVLDGDDRWATACHDVGTSVAVVATRIRQESSRGISTLILGLAAMVGISTAFGVLQILSPLSKITVELARVQAGERGVVLGASGLAEIDALIERVNAAARAMEDREDAILARNEVVQEIARVVAHEIRNPLQSLEFLAGLIAQEDDRAEREELAGSIQAEVRLLEHVVTRMLKASDGTALQLIRRDTPVASIIDKVISFRRPEARHRGVQLLEGPVSSRSVSMDKTLVSRAIENLIVNSLAFVPRETGKIVLSVEEVGDYMVFKVEDNGPGIPEDVGANVFKSEFSTRPDGHGLGLALVQGVFESHGGYVEHERSELGGAAFMAYLPLTDPTPEQAGSEDPGRG